MKHVWLILLNRKVKLIKYILYFIVINIIIFNVIIINQKNSNKILSIPYSLTITITFRVNSKRKFSRNQCSDWLLKITYKKQLLMFWQFSKRLDIMAKVKLLKILMILFWYLKSLKKMNDFLKRKIN